MLGVGISFPFSLREKTMPYLVSMDMKHFKPIGGVLLVQWIISYLSYINNNMS